MSFLGVLACVAGWLLGRGRGFWLIPLCVSSALAVGLGGAALAPLCLVLGWSAACDLRDMEVPDAPWWAAAGAWLLLGGAVPRVPGAAGAVFALVLGVALQVLAGRLYGRAAYGGADVKLGAVAGLYLGVPGFLLGLLLGSLFGVAHGLWLRGSRRLGPREPFPFVPALAAGTLVAAGFLPLWESLLGAVAGGVGWCLR